MINTVDYKDILMNYGAMMNEAPTKKKGLALVKADWETKKQQMEVSIDTALVDVGIRMMAVSRKRFDMNNFLETDIIPNFNSCDSVDLNAAIVLFWVLRAFKEEPEIKACLDHIMDLWAEDLDALDIFNREDFFEKVMNDMMGYTITKLNCWTLQELFDFYLSYIFDCELDELLDFDCNLSEEEMAIYECFSNQYSITAVMKYMYSELYERIKHMIFGNGVE